MKSTILLLLCSLIMVSSLQAQTLKGELGITLNKNIFTPGDSLQLKLDYKNAGAQNKKQSLATVELIIENEAGQGTRLRWPMIDGQASGSIFLPDSLPPGKYTLFAGLQERFFEVVGEIRDNKKPRSIKAMLLTQTGDWTEQELSVDPEGKFRIRNWLFEDNALLAFQGTRNNDQSLDIRISTQLDSSSNPIAVAGKSFYIGNPPADVRQTLDQPVETPEAVFTDRATLLPAVIVRGSSKSRAQQFNDEHVTGLFRSSDERLISVLDDPSAIGYNNIFSYLQGRIAGLQIAPSGAARWRGGRVTFFLDEMRTSAQQIASVPMADIAIVKAYPPPFLGATGGGAAVAVYTRRGGERNYLPANRQVFKVRGYTPSATALDLSKQRI